MVNELSIILKLIASDLKTCVANEMAAMSGAVIPFPDFSPPQTRIPAALLHLLASRFDAIAAIGRLSQSASANGDEVK